MGKTKKIAIVFAALAVLMLAGCTGDFTASMQNITKELKTMNFSLNASDDIADFQNGTCIAMVCQNKTPAFPYSLFFDSSLKGGNCTFQPCNQSQYKDLAINRTAVNKELSIRMFMFGAGHSFLQYSDANLFCNNSMKMGVKWLVANNFTSYPVPTSKRAECFLDKNIIPVYMLYSSFAQDGSRPDVNVARAGEIAANLSGSGPVIIISDAELDDNSTNRYGAVIAQINLMKQKCPTCQIALGVKLNGTSEYNVTRAILSDPSVAKNIDMVAYGINSHNFKDCMPDKILWYASTYSKFVLYNYSKPTLVSYALFDAANSSDNSCIWYNESVGNAYSDLYAYLGFLQSNGVIGVSLYSFYGGGPLMCQDCAFMDPNFGQSGDNLICQPYYAPQKINPRFFNYFGFCQAYYNGIGENISGLLPIVFSNGSTNCNFAFNDNILRYLNISDSEIKPLGVSSIQKNDPFFTCAGCAGSVNMTTAFTNDIPTPSTDNCGKYKPPLEIAADNFDMDPTLLRAAVWEESNTTSCKVGYRPMSDTSCNPLNLPAVPDVNLDNHDGCCVGLYTETWYVDPNAPNPAFPCRPGSQIPGAHGEQCKPCAYGAAQVIEYPSKIYKDNPGLPLPDVVKACASKITDGYPDFNPYRPYDGPCDYAYKFMYINLPKGYNTTDKYNMALDVGTDSNKRDWFAAFFGLDWMFGHESKPACHLPSETQEDWINHFDVQKNRGDCSTSPVACIGDAPGFVRLNNLGQPACCGNKDFMNYVKYCEHNGSFSYSYDTLAKYKGLSTSPVCGGSYCPERGFDPSTPALSDKNIMKYLCENGYVANAGGVDCCSSAQILPGIYSAWWFCYFNPATPPQCKAKYCQ